VLGCVRSHQIAQRLPAHFGRVIGASEDRKPNCTMALFTNISVAIRRRGEPPKPAPSEWTPRPEPDTSPKPFGDSTPN
jgi:hypothetical protein